MVDANRLALGPGTHQRSTARRQAPGGPGASTPPPASPPPGARASTVAKPAKGRRRLFGR
jgi:hypothetical protein